MSYNRENIVALMKFFAELLSDFVSQSLFSEFIVIAVDGGAYEIASALQIYENSSRGRYGELLNTNLFVENLILRQSRTRFLDLLKYIANMITHAETARFNRFEENSHALVSQALALHTPIITQMINDPLGFVEDCNNFILSDDCSEESLATIARELTELFNFISICSVSKQTFTHPVVYIGETNKQFIRGQTYEKDILAEANIAEEYYITNKTLRLALANSNQLTIPMEDTETKEETDEEIRCVEISEESGAVRTTEAAITIMPTIIEVPHAEVLANLAPNPRVAIKDQLRELLISMKTILVNNSSYRKLLLALLARNNLCCLYSFVVLGLFVTSGVFVKGALELDVLSISILLIAFVLGSLGLAFPMIYAVGSAYDGDIEHLKYFFTPYLEIEAIRKALSQLVHGNENLPGEERPLVSQENGRGYGDMRQLIVGTFDHVVNPQGLEQNQEGSVPVDSIGGQLSSDTSSDDIIFRAPSLTD